MISRKRLLLFAALTAGTLLLLVLCWPYVFAYTFVVRLSGGLSRIEREICMPENYQPVGKDLAVLSTFTNATIQSHDLPNNWKPESIARLRSLWWHAGPDGAGVLFTCGFSHLSYRLERSETATSPCETIWDLYFDDEGRRKDLHRVAVTEADRARFDRLVEQLIEEFEKQIAEDPSSSELLRRKTTFLLITEFRESALSTCRQARQLDGSSGWFAFVDASLTAEKEGSVRGHEILRDWTAEDPDLSRYFWLACFCREHELRTHFKEAVADSVAFVAEACDPNSKIASYLVPMVILAHSESQKSLASTICEKVEDCLKGKASLQTDAYAFVVRLRQALRGAEDANIGELAWRYCSELKFASEDNSRTMYAWVPSGARKIPLGIKAILWELAASLEPQPASMLDM